MTIFATEFPVIAEISDASFVAEALSWIKGISKSSVLDKNPIAEIYDDDVRLEGDNGETLSFKTVITETDNVIGVRHELLDATGRTWRTECVLTRNDVRSTLRVRGQCVALTPGAEVLMPKKPHLIRQALDEGWAAEDGEFDVQDKPHYLGEDAFEAANNVVSGLGASLLPCIYVSRCNDNSLPLDVSKLAKQLSGVAHVIVEPSRGFSFSLMEISKRKNPYGGAIGIAFSGTEKVIRLFPFGNKREFLEELCSLVVREVSKRSPQFGWEWQTLQERQAQVLRAKIVESVSGELDEYIEQFDSEMSAKDERIQNLEELLALEQASRETEDITSGDLVPNGLKDAIGPELYDGEFSDRLRLLIVEAIDGSIANLDNRTQAIARKIVSISKFSGRAVSLVNQIKNAGRDGKQMPKRLGAILSGMGFARSDEGKHTKYTPPEQLLGLQVEVFPSTPSDGQRGGKNRASEVIKSFGLPHLK